jgi:ferredoxin-like protein FixX
MTLNVGDACDEYLKQKGTSFSAEGCPECPTCRFYEDHKQILATEGIDI